MGFGGPMPPPGFGGRESHTIATLSSSYKITPLARPPFPPGPGGFAMPPGAPPFPPNGAVAGGPPGKHLSPIGTHENLTYLFPNSGGPSFPPNGGPPFPPGGMNIPPGFSAAGAVFSGPPPPSQGAPPNSSNNGPPPANGAAPTIHPDRLRMMSSNR